MKLIHNPSDHQSSTICYTPAYVIVLEKRGLIAQKFKTELLVAIILGE